MEHHKRTQCGRRRTTDRGNSLIEVMASIILMSIVAAAILPAIWTAARAGRVSNSEASTDAVLTAAVDRVTRGGWLACPATDASGGYEARVDAAAATAGFLPADVSVVAIMYWNTATKTWSTTNPFAPGCTSLNSAVSPDATMQIVTIQAVSPNGRHTKTIDAIVGNVTAGGTSA